MISSLFWNVRGIVNKASIHGLCKLCRIHSISVLFLFDPMSSTDHISRLKDYLHFANFLFSHNKKMCVLWCHDFSLVLQQDTSQLLHCQVDHPNLTHSVSYLVSMPKVPDLSTKSYGLT